jgi:hypothetical protein
MTRGDRLSFKAIRRTLRIIRSGSENKRTKRNLASVYNITYNSLTRNLIETGMDLYFRFAHVQIVCFICLDSMRHIAVSWIQYTESVYVVVWMQTLWKKNSYKLVPPIISEYYGFNENHKSITFVRNLSCLYCTQTTLHVSAIRPSSGASHI